MVFNLLEFKNWDGNRIRDFYRWWFSAAKQSFDPALRFKSQFVDIADVKLKLLDSSEIIQNHFRSLNDDFISKFIFAPSIPNVYLSGKVTFHIIYYLDNYFKDDKIKDQRLIETLSNRPDLIQVVNSILISCFVKAMEFFDFRISMKGIIVSGSRNFRFETGYGESLRCSEIVVNNILNWINEPKDITENGIIFTLSEIIHELTHLIRQRDVDEGITLGPLNEIVSHLVQFLYRPDNVGLKNQILGSLRKILNAVKHRDLSIIDQKYDIATLMFLVFIVHRLRRYPESQNYPEIRDFDSFDLEKQFEVLMMLDKILYWYDEPVRKRIAREVIEEFIPYTTEHLGQLYLQVEHELNLKKRLHELQR